MIHKDYVMILQLQDNITHKTYINNDINIYTFKLWFTHT